MAQNPNQGQQNIVKTYPCRVEGCDLIFSSRQTEYMHVKKFHQDQKLTQKRNEILNKLKNENYLHCNNCFALIKNEDSMRRHKSRGCGKEDLLIKEIVLNLQLREADDEEPIIQDNDNKQEELIDQDINVVVDQEELDILQLIQPKNDLLIESQNLNSQNQIIVDPPKGINLIEEEKQPVINSSEDQQIFSQQSQSIINHSSLNKFSNYAIPLNLKQKVQSIQKFIQDQTSSLVKQVMKDENDLLNNQEFELNYQPPKIVIKAIYKSSFQPTGYQQLNQQQPHQIESLYLIKSMLLSSKKNQTNSQISKQDLIDNQTQYTVETKNLVEILPINRKISQNIIQQSISPTKKRSALQEIKKHQQVLSPSNIQIDKQEQNIAEQEEQKFSLGAQLQGQGCTPYQEYIELTESEDSDVIVTGSQSIGKRRERSPSPEKNNYFKLKRKCNHNNYQLDKFLQQQHKQSNQSLLIDTPINQFEMDKLLKKEMNMKALIEFQTLYIKKIQKMFKENDLELRSEVIKYEPWEQVNEMSYEEMSKILEGLLNNDFYKQQNLQNQRQLLTDYASCMLSQRAFQNILGAIAVQLKQIKQYQQQLQKFEAFQRCSSSIIFKLVHSYLQNKRLYISSCNNDGGCGKIFYGVLKSNSIFEQYGLKINEQYAIKVPLVDSIDTVRNEMKTLDILHKDNKKADSKLIIKFIQTIKIQDLEIAIMNRYSQSLFDYMQKNPLCDKQIQLFSYCILKAISYAHSLKITHGDIKLENILLDKNLTPIIIDWGFSRYNNNLGEDLFIQNTVQYAAPQIFQYNNSLNDKISVDFYKADAYAIGVIMYELQNKTFPFQKEEYQSIYDTGKLPRLPFFQPNFTNTIGYVIYQLLQEDQDRRWTVDQALQSLFFKGCNLNSILKQGISKQKNGSNRS